VTAPVYGDDLGVDTLTPDCGLRHHWDTEPDDRPAPPPALLVDAAPVAAHAHRIEHAGVWGGGSERQRRRTRRT